MFHFMIGRYDASIVGCSCDEKMLFCFLPVLISVLSVDGFEYPIQHLQNFCGMLQ